MSDLFELVGDVVRLAPLAAAHVDALFAAATRERATYALTLVPATRDAMAAYVAAALDERAAGRAVPFVTVRRADDEIVGSTRFAALGRWVWPSGGAPSSHAPGAPDVAEIGWTWLRPDAQRTAVNTEAKRLMLAHAFETWGVRRVSLRTDARNARSRAAIERLGARLDGVLRAEMLGYDGVARDTAWYSVLAAEWPAVRARLDARLGARPPSGRGAP